MTISLNAEQLDTFQRLAETIARDANQALREAQLDTIVEVKRAKVGFHLVFNPYLDREAQRRAYAITDAVLEGAFARVFNLRH